MKNKGFTLVELLATIALVAILATSAIVGVNYMINKQKQNLATVAEEHIAQAAVTYFSNKKNLYIEPCKDRDEDAAYTNFNQTSLKILNDDLRQTMIDQNKTTDEDKYNFAKDYVKSVNTDETSKNAFNESYAFVSNTGCYKLVTVGELIEAGLLEDRENMCDKASVVLVYQRGDSKNKAGVLTSMQEPQICNGKKRKQLPPAITVSPDKDTNPSGKKTVKVSIVDDNKALKNSITLKYAWTTNSSGEPGSWETVNMSITDKKKGSITFEKTGLDGTYYLWIKSEGTIDRLDNTITPFASGPYTFLPPVTVSYSDENKGCSSETKVVVFDKAYGLDIDENPAELCVPTGTKNGYTFARWDYNGATIDNNSIVSTKNNHTLLAKWTANTYKVTFDSNDGSECNPTEKQVTYDQNYGALCSTSRGAGYDFKGWKNLESGAIVTDGTKVTTAKNHILQAQWDGKEFNITYSNPYSAPSGGTNCNGTIKKVKYAKPYGDLCEPTRSGYIFVGWYYNSNKILAGTIMNTTSDHTLTATWRPDTFTIKYHGNGNTNTAADGVTLVTMSDKTCKHDLNCFLDKSLFEKDNSTFSGWALSATGPVAFEDCRDRRDDEAGSVDAGDDDYVIDEEDDGEDEGGEEEEEEEVADPNLVCVNIKDSVDKNATTINLYAKYEGNPYTIRYLESPKAAFTVLGEGEEAPECPGNNNTCTNCTYGTACTIRSAPPTTAGTDDCKNFLRWTDGTNVYAAGETVMDLGDKELKPVCFTPVLNDTISKTYEGAEDSVTFSIKNNKAIIVDTKSATSGSISCTASAYNSSEGLHIVNCTVSNITNVTDATTNALCSAINGGKTTLYKATYSFKKGKKVLGAKKCFKQAKHSPCGNKNWGKYSTPKYNDYKNFSNINKGMWHHCGHRQGGHVGTVCSNCYCKSNGTGRVGCLTYDQYKSGKCYLNRCFDWHHANQRVYSTTYTVAYHSNI